MTLNRIFYILLMFGTWVLASYYKNAVTCILVYAVILLPIMSFLLLLFGYFSMDASQKVNTHIVYKGDSVRVTFNARCRFALSFAYLDLRLNRAGVSKFKLKRADTILCACFGQPVSVRLDVECPYRGVYQVGSPKLRMHDMLGLFTLIKRIDTCKVTVYPRVSSVVGLTIDRNLINNASITKNALKKDDIMVSHVRPYQSTDRPKTINWKISSKVNELMVKNYEPLKETGMTVMLDLQSKTDLPRITRINNEDKIIECGLSVVANCLSDMLTAKVIYIPKGNVMSEHNVDEIQNYPDVYNLLACITVDGVTPVSDFLREFATKNLGTNLVVITDRTDEKLHTAFREAANAGNKLTLIRVVGDNEKQKDWQSEVEEYMRDGFKTVAVESSHRGPIVF